MASTGPVRSRLQDSIGEYEKLFDKMNQHAEVGDIASAENCLAVCLAAMPQKRRMIHNTMLKACANAGAFRRAVLVFSKMLADGVTPSPRTFGKLLTCAARSGEGRWQQRLMQVAPELSRLDGCSWGALLDQLARQGQTAEVLKLIQATGMSLDQKSIGTMVTAFAKAAQPEEAQQWLHKMSPPDLEAYNSVAHGFAKRGQVEEVEKWLKRAEDLSLDLSMVSYGCLVDACAKASSAQLALRALQRAKDAKLQPNAMTYNAAMDACAKCGNFAQAQEIFTTMQDQQMVTMESVTSLVRASSRAKRPWQESEALLCNTQHSVASLPGADLRLLNCVVEACAKANAVDRCIFWLDEMKSKALAPNVISFTSALSGCKGPGSRTATQCDRYPPCSQGYKPKSFAGVCKPRV